MLRSSFLQYVFFVCLYTSRFSKALTFWLLEPEIAFLVEMRVNLKGVILNDP